MQFDDLSHKSSGSSLNQPQNQIPANTESLEYTNADTLRKSNTLPKQIREPKIPVQDEWEQKLYRGKQGKSMLLEKKLKTCIYCILFFVDVLKSGSADSLNVRSSWESPKLSSRIEEEDTVEIQLEDSKPITPIKTPEVPVKQEKESLSSKFKNFRKGIVPS